jgi:hypothetical protein
MYVLMTVVASLALAAVGRYVFKLRLKWLA